MKAQMIHQTACRSVPKAKSLHKRRCDLSFFDDLPCGRPFIRGQHLLEIRGSALVDFKKLLPFIGFGIVHPPGGDRNPALIGDQLNGFWKWHFFCQHHK